MSSKKQHTAVLLVAILTCCTSIFAQQSPKTKDKFSAYLFVYFTGNSIENEQIKYAISDDGYNYKALNKNHPVINSKEISLTGGVRDPHILRCEDGKTFYMVATDMVSAKGWSSNRGMVLMKSTDLIHWKSTAINIPSVFPDELSDVLRVWAPQTIYDSVAKKYMIYFSMLKSGAGEYDKIYYCYANKDFTALETAPKQLFFQPQNKSCIDGDIIYSNGKYHLFFKTEGNGNGIKKAVSNKINEGYVMEDKYLQQTKDAVEGSGVFKLNNSDSWILMYDVYGRGRYQFTKSDDLENFKVIDNDVTMDFHPRHGTIIQLTAKEAERLKTAYLTADVAFESAQSPQILINNIVVDSKKKSVTFLVEKEADISKLNPDFKTVDGIKIKPNSARNFSKGTLKYKVKIPGKKAETYTANAIKYGNPVLHGFYADPDILYAEKTGKFYIYPTSDGFTGWSGTYFKVFSSDNLSDWKDEGKIIQLGEDVKWADKNAWAPCIVEKKIDGKYKYFYYFTAAQKIGVAVSDNPTDPFIDLGKPLIDARPEGITRGQVIDPDVFTDPKTGKSYLYYGNGFMVGAELNEDMTSIKPETLTVLKPDNTFREGTYVFFRNDKYYFMWSEDDTRSENYRVRYAMSDSPLGNFTIPKDNLVIAKNADAGIYGTGHNSVIQIPGKDEWYIVYHRFNYPKGINMGEAAGYNREVCIDKMEFNSDGTIKTVIPTHEGIAPVVTK